MDKTFFTSDVIDAYTNFEVGNKKLIKNNLGDFELLNYKQFMEWWNDYPTDLEVDKTKLDELVINTLNCGFNITSAYISNAKYFVSNLDTFDMLVAVYKKNNINFNNDDTVYTYQRRKSELVSGFIIIELGECKKKPSLYRSIVSTVLHKWNKTKKKIHDLNFNHVYSVYLICCRERFEIEKIPSFKCQILLGAYLFAIKSNPLYTQIGILELVNGYLNIPGFIAYSKLGFVKDLDLYKKNCFHSLGNLPMLNDLNRIPLEMIVQSVANDIALIIPKDAREILFFYSQTQNNKSKQEELASYYNFLYKLELESIKIIDECFSYFLKKDVDDAVIDGEDDDDFAAYLGIVDITILFDIFYNRDGSFKYNNSSNSNLYSAIKNETLKIIQSKLNPYLQLLKKRKETTHTSDIYIEGVTATPTDLNKRTKYSSSTTINKKSKSKSKSN